MHQIWMFAKNIEDGIWQCNNTIEYKCLLTYCIYTYVPFWLATELASNVVKPNVSDIDYCYCGIMYDALYKDRLYDINGV